MLCNFSLFAPWSAIYPRARNSSLYLHALSDAGYIGHHVTIRIVQTSSPNYTFTRVVCGGNQSQLAVEFVHQPSQIADSSRDVLLQVAAIADAESCGCTWHQLHDPGSAFRRYGAHLPTRFLLHHGPSKIKRDSVVFCVSGQVILRLRTAVGHGLAISPDRRQKEKSPNQLCQCRASAL